MEVAMKDTKDSTASGLRDKQSLPEATLAEVVFSGECWVTVAARQD